MIAAPQVKIFAAMMEDKKRRDACEKAINAWMRKERPYITSWRMTEVPSGISVIFVFQGKMKKGA